MANDLILRQAPASGPPNVLIFGEPETPSTAAHFTGRIPLPAFRVSGTALAKRPPRAAASGRLALPAFVTRGTTRYDSAVSRPLVGNVSSAWQVAEPARAGVVARHQNAALGQLGQIATWQRAAPRAAVGTVRWQDAAHARCSVGVRHQAAEPLAMSSGQRHQEAGRVVRGGVVRWQAAEQLAPPPVAVRFQEALRLRSLAVAKWQRAARLYRAHSEAFGVARVVDRGWLARWQAAMPPLPGRSAVVVPLDPCYVPSTQLVFRERQRYSTKLIFRCEHTGPDEPGTPPLFIPLLRFYMATHHLEAVMLPSLDRVPLSDVVIEADAGMPHWRLSASGPLGLLDQFGMTGTPRLIRVTVDGLPWVFAIEGRGRSRVPGERRARLTGRSVPALLGANRLPAQTWLNNAPITALQIVNQALQFTDVTIDWQIPDWLVPAGAWSFKGKPLAAAVRVAEAVGAVLQSHPTDPTLIYLPRYKVLPWEWDSSAVTADVAVASAAIRTDDLEVDEQPEWECVYVFGTAQGVGRRVVRGGTAGEILAEQVTDDLITAHEAAVERGRSILGGGGAQAQVSLSMPILTGGTLPGVLQVNQLLEVIEPQENWRGLVRAVSVRASMEEVSQTVRVERHFL